jgi:predicted CXXCH cytochrome family protein
LALESGAGFRYNAQVHFPRNFWRRSASVPGVFGKLIEGSRWIRLTAVVLISGVVAFFSSCSTVTRTVVAPPQIEGAVFVGNKACADCHTNIARMFPMSPHARHYKDSPEWASIAGCESCHGAGSKHVAAGGGRGRFIVNPRQDPGACLTCHVAEHAEFSLPSHHPVMEGNMSCVSCHDPHGREIFKPAGGLAMARVNESCATCHREQARHFVYEHKALREGCVSCHSPHGSINAKMLVERDVNLCLKCHAQQQGASGQVMIGKQDHTFLVSRGTCWSAGCHTAVHGSNVSPRMLH